MIIAWLCCESQVAYVVRALELLLVALRLLQLLLALRELAAQQARGHVARGRQAVYT